MKNHIFAICSFVFIGLFLGCASSLTRNECLEADWYEIGFIDGSRGAPRALFRKHADTCMKYNVHVGREAYYRGRDQGLKIYCTKDKGFNLGRSGKKYNSICPQDLERDFLAGYTKGKQTYKFESKISSLEQRLQRIESQIQSKQKQLHSSDLSEERRAEIETDLKDLDVDYRYTLKDLRHWEKMKPSD